MAESEQPVQIEATQKRVKISPFVLRAPDILAVKTPRGIRSAIRVRLKY